MSEAGLPRPKAGDHAPYYDRYIALVPEEQVLPVLAAQGEELRRALAGVKESGAGFRYAGGKWSIREVVGHLADTERVFAFRALSFARAEKAALPAFDENEYVREASFDATPLAELVEEFRASREASMYLFRHLTAEAWLRGGVANAKPIVVRSLAFIMAGHVRHHLGTLRTLYHVGEAL
jgi:hypothetical protein